MTADITPSSIAADITPSSIAATRFLLLVDLTTGRVAARAVFGRKTCVFTIPSLCTGRGTATGGGYHLHSAALQYAMSKAGVHLSESIDGAGNSAMHRAFEAIGEALNIKFAVIDES